MKKRVKMSNKSFYSLIAILLLFGISIAIAYGTNNPQVFGHSIGEIDGIPTCTNSQVLNKNSSGWNCVNAGSGGYTWTSGVTPQSATNPSAPNPREQVLQNIGAGRHCLANVESLSNVVNSCAFCSYESSTGNVKAHYCGERVTCRYTCLN